MLAVARTITSMQINACDAGHFLQPSNDKSRLFIVAYGAHDNTALAHSSKSNPTHCTLLF